jgi:predicted GIY-YIG superfamily endonuclease
MPDQPAIYILANKPYGTLYTGVTSNLIQRVHQHKHDMFKGFTYTYNCKMLVYFELLGDIDLAISREKQIKAGSRAKKIKLINSINPYWIDLYPTLIGRAF